MPARRTETTDPLQNDAISSIRKGDSTIHKLVVDGRTNHVVEVNGTYYYADDIILSKEQFNTLKKMTSSLSTQERATIAQDFSATWPGATVYSTNTPKLCFGGLSGKFENEEFSKKVDLTQKALFSFHERSYPQEP